MIPDSELLPLVWRYQAGDPDAAAQLCHAFEQAIAERAGRAAQRRIQTRREDLLQVGYLGVLQEARAWRESDRSFRLVVERRVWREMLTLIGDEYLAGLHLSSHARLSAMGIYRIRSQLAIELRRQPTIDELLAAPGLPYWARCGSLAARRARVTECVDAMRWRLELDYAQGPDSESVGDNLLVPEPPELVERTDLREALERALADLTPRQRAVLHARFVEGLTRGQTAARLGIHPNSVGVFEKYGLKRLRRDPRVLSFIGNRAD